SGGKLTIPIKLEGLARGEQARVTVSAVDVGILNLTRFKSPDPLGWFYSQVKLGTEIRDLYGRLIDGMRAERGVLRSGGDQDGGMSMTGNPPVEKMLSLHSGIVKVGADGAANVEFDLPDFNGTARVMVVAWSDTKLGSASKDVVVRDDVALTASAPRFLTLGDEARLDLSLHNVEGPAGSYQLAVEKVAAGGPASIVGRNVQLAAGERKSERMTLKPTSVGPAEYLVRLTGPGGLNVKRTLTFDVKAPGGDIKRVTVAKLAPRSGRLLLTDDLVTDMIASRTRVNVSVGPLASFDVPGLLSQLDRYPYGCAEQTTSRALPLLYANELSAQIGMRSDNALRERVQAAIDRVFEMQDASGAFGVWGPSNTDMWLTAYVTDFLTRAKEANYDVRPQAFASALDRLQSFVSYAQDFEKGGENRAYALYVLARNGRAPAGELRYYVDTRLERFATALSKAQLGAALAMLGDRERAEKAFSAAIAHIANESKAMRSDYGSSLRDSAALVTLASEVRMMQSQAPRLADVIAKAFAERSYTSTQEQAWMLLAAHALSEVASSTELSVDGTPHKGSLIQSIAAGQLSSGARLIANTGDNEVSALVSVIGLARTPEPATEKGFSIERTYYTLDGRKIDMKSAAGGEGSVRQNDRMVVVVKVTAAEKGGRVLLVDRLPAGLEIENPRIIDSADLKSLSWLKTDVKPEHTEFRDDRFVAAFNFSAKPNNAGRGASNKSNEAQSSAMVAYMVRAVTPGTYVHPAASVEDMYRPERYARTAAGRLTVEARE
ncbi:MAG: alpha-2-macroglobulin, partial [Pseudorhodoplanes sp.]